MHAALWRPPFAVGEFERSEGEFAPFSGVGRVVFVGSEADQIISDPVYGFGTGIARDGDLNARGGVRLPDLRVGRARFIAVDFSVPGLPLTGTSIDLACQPRPDAASRPGRPHAMSRHAPRFRNHGEYVSAFTRQANRLVEAGFLLRVDAERLTGAAARSGVGKPGTCPGVIQSPH